jgi:hypothetical protein
MVVMMSEPQSLACMPMIGELTLENDS